MKVESTLGAGSRSCASWGAFAPDAAAKKASRVASAVRSPCRRTSDWACRMPSSARQASLSMFLMFFSPLGAPVLFGYAGRARLIYVGLRAGGRASGWRSAGGRARRCGPLLCKGHLGAEGKDGGYNGRDRHALVHL